MAEAYYGIPKEIIHEGLLRLTEEMKAVTERFYKAVKIFGRQPGLVVEEDMTVEEAVQKIRSLIEDPDLSEEDRSEIISLIERFRDMVEESESKEDLVEIINQMMKERG